MHKRPPVMTVPFSLTNPELVRDPYHYYKTMRDSSPVFLSVPDNTYFLTRYTDINFALKNPAIFSSKGTANILQPAWLYDEGIKEYPIVFEDPPQHTLHRQAISSAFVHKAVDELQFYIEQIVSDLISLFPAANDIELVAMFAQPLVDRVMFYHLGIDYNEDDATLFRQWASMIEAPPLSLDTAHKKDLHRINALVSSRIDLAIKSRKQALGGDLIGMYLKQDTALSHAKKCEIIEILLLAGMQATPHLLSRAVLYLSHDRALFEQLANNAELIPPFIEELLRYDPPVHLVARKTTNEVVISNIAIPKGADIILITASANRDCSQFPDADGFNIHRSNHSHLAFSGGIHQCLGHTVARKTVTIALEALLSRFKQFKCPPRKTLDWFYSYSVYGFRTLPIIFK